MNLWPSLSPSAEKRKEFGCKFVPSSLAGPRWKRSNTWSEATVSICHFFRRVATRNGKQWDPMPIIGFDRLPLKTFLGSEGGISICCTYQFSTTVFLP